MTQPRDVEQGADAANDRLSDAYREAVGSVMAARKLYDDACAAQGAESWAAQQAQNYLTREIEHRNQLRERYDLVIDGRLKR